MKIDIIIYWIAEKKTSFLKNCAALLTVFFLTVANCMPDSSSQINDDSENINNHSHLESKKFPGLEFTMQHENDYRSTFDPKVIALILHIYPHYKFYPFSCSGHYTQTAVNEYLVPMLSPDMKFIRYLLLKKIKHTKYKIQEFGKLKLTRDNTDWAITICGNTNDILKDWKSKDLEREKWFQKPLNNGLGYFCVIRDDSPYLFTCYQYDKKHQKFNKVYGTYWGDY